MKKKELMLMVRFSIEENELDCNCVFPYSLTKCEKALPRMSNLIASTINLISGSSESLGQVKFKEAIQNKIDGLLIKDLIQRSGVEKIHISDLARDYFFNELPEPIDTPQETESIELKEVFIEKED